jgi:tetratricopeptide (TPR) repeat protein
LTRTRRRKLLYLATVVIGAGVVVGVIALFNLRWPLVFGLAVMLLLPSRIQGYYWRAFFRGRHLMAVENYDAAIREFAYFLSLLDRRPWLERLIWLNGSIYTSSARAMTLNNLGAAELMLGHYAEAEHMLEAALRHDPEAPLPHFNLAVAAQAQQKGELAESHLRRAQELGYTRATSDQLVHQLGLLLARLEGRGSSVSA